MCVVHHPPVRPSVVAHRGSSADAPEHTLDAYVRAYEAWRSDTRTWASDGQPYPTRERLYDRG